MTLWSTSFLYTFTKQLLFFLSRCNKMHSLFPMGRRSFRGIQPAFAAIFDYFAAEGLRLTTNTPKNTRPAARSFCHVNISIPMIMLITVAIIGCI